MKNIILIIACLICASCSQEGSIKLHYSGEFKVSLPTDFMSNSTIVYTDGLAVKTSTGKVFSGHIISDEIEKLPKDFDIRLYPEYILKIRPSTDLDNEIAKLFDNSANAIDHTYNLKNLEILKNNGETIYSVCQKDECLAMVVKDNFSEHILYVFTQKIGKTEFINLLRGGLNVNK